MYVTLTLPFPNLFLPNSASSPRLGRKPWHSEIVRSYANKKINSNSQGVSNGSRSKSAQSTSMIGEPSGGPSPKTGGPSPETGGPFPFISGSSSRAPDPPESEELEENIRRAMVYAYCALHCGKNARVNGAAPTNVVNVAKMSTPDLLEWHYNNVIKPAYSQQQCEYIKKNINDVSYVGMCKRGLDSCFDIVTSNASEQGNWSLAAMLLIVL